MVDDITREIAFAIARASAEEANRVLADHPQKDIFITDPSESASAHWQDYLPQARAVVQCQAVIVSLAHAPQRRMSV
ncbi:hypothetical protein [Bosea sp. NPDC055594]